MFKKVTAFLIIAALVVAGGFYAFKSLLPPPKKEAQGPVYSTAKVIRGDISVGVETSGPLYPNSSGGIMVPYNPESQGMLSYIIDEVLVKAGDTVQAGQVLVRLRAPNIQTELENLQKQLETAKKALADKLGTTPDKLYEVDPSKGITLTAPIDGRVFGFSAKEGNEIKEGEIVAKIVNDSKFKLLAKLYPGEFAVAKDYKKAFLRFNVYEGVLEGEVVDVNDEPVTEAAGGTDYTGEKMYQYVYYMTIEGKNPGLIQPELTAYVGLAKEGVKNPESPDVLWLKYPSKVEGFAEEESVFSTVTARVTKVFVKERSKVKKGDPLIQLAGSDVRDYILEEMKKISELESKMYKLQNQLSMLEIRAPVSGVVADFNATVGKTVNMGEWLGNIFNPDDMTMWCQVDDIDILLVKQGSPVKVTLDALPGKTLEGSVVFISPMGKDQSGISRFEVNIKVKGTPELKPGMQAKAYIEAGSAKNVLLVPVEAVFEEDGQPKVEVLNPDGTTKVVNVELGLMNDRYAEIKSGLNEGDEVVTGSSFDVLPSQHIKTDRLLPGQNGNQGSGTGNQNSGGK
ncbi:efflux RND transporter periplasmic adaptor subunit [Thermovenabulum gondwanense]|uniref:Putative efflux system component YknX n=1 Tax=Thermovenabulum gondwanense TaxID=520767 RepID=A0A162MI03_9FIRM|nr:efflux RND transporter periplasmic adaptor subunit [Thermovenabulum gondwanense]KYO66118.1 putative efflux system component YknX [Thermovenabulum gondwanense]